MFPFDHPLSLGSWVEDRHITDVLDDADVLVVVGTALGEITSNYYTLKPRGELIQIDAHVRVLESNYLALGIRADTGLALQEIMWAIEEQSGPAVDSNWRGQTSTTLVREVHQRVQDRLAAQDLQHELDVLQAIRAAVPSDAQTFWDMTIAGYWAWNTWGAQQGLFHSAHGAGGVGYAFPSAFGGAVGAQQRVLAVSGDGSAMYSIAELAAAKQHDVPVTWLIIDDGGYGILREYMNHTFGQTTATELTRPNFAKLAEAFGIPATVAEVDTLQDALQTAWKAQGPNVVVLATTLAMWAPTHN